MKRITRSALQNCKVNFRELNRHCRTFDSHVKGLLIQMIEYVLRADECNQNLFLLYIIALNNFLAH
ncbi:MAG: hypothetical protein ACC656_07420, partial [Candidatus Heimdallarchaeota archaeon]